jgi:hypothetical protein
MSFILVLKARSKPLLHPPSIPPPCRLGLQVGSGDDQFVGVDPIPVYSHIADGMPKPARLKLVLNQTLPDVILDVKSFVKDSLIVHLYDTVIRQTGYFLSTWPPPPRTSE